MSSHKTIAALSQPRIRQTPSVPRAPLTAEEKKKKREDSPETQAQIDEAVGEWWAQTYSKAVQLAQRFDKKPCYFLDMMFQGGARMVNHHEKVNPYNAFKSEKAAQVCEEGLQAKNAPALHDEHFEEYLKLTPEEKANLVERFTESKRDAAKLCCDTPRARMRDVSNTVRNIQMMFHGLTYRVGVEGFFCIVRNTSDFHMAPQWYFTSKELERYMPLAVRKKWDTGEVGTRLEAFAVAGCNTTNLLRTSKQKTDFLKVEIRQGVLTGLGTTSCVEITQNANAEMSYVHYDEDIVHRYGVEC
ncbi:hypothetical protein DFH09DRAFT_1311850 [Mycena vulgaris]|nr:hypothetical protein DFH09DRAFT_1311850 [Mycena vulgaris]